MARLFLLYSLLEEAHAVDNYEARRQAKNVHKLSPITRDDQDENYVEKYRLSEELINQLERDLRPLLKTTRRQGKGLSRRIKILCTLSFLANGSHQKMVKQNLKTHLSQSSTSRCINEVVEALNHPAIVRKYIKFPQNLQERLELKERFYEKFKIPNVIGCMDGTFVSMVRPPENEELYYCCKGCYARNVQVITDADHNILHVNPTHGGVHHDSFIFNYCTIKNNLQGLTNDGEQVVLLGDSEYPQQTYVMTPLANAQENSPEAFYNQCHMAAFSSVGRAIALLKGRFKCLLVSRALHYHPEVVVKMVIACSVLHNMCNRAGLPEFKLTKAEEEEEAQFISKVQAKQTRDLPSEADLAVGQLSRRELINSLWRARHVCVNDSDL